MKSAWLILALLQIYLIACSNSEQVLSEEILTEGFFLDSLALNESLVRDSLLRDSLLNDSLLRDSLYRDSLLKDSLVKDSLLNDSLLRDSLFKDSVLRADSLAEIERMNKNGMFLIASKGMSVELGTNIADARVSERPSMKVKLDYDFYLSKHETTCAEFNGLMKKATGLTLECEDENLPATNVTYFDAVLFANERSKENELDTAYTYASARFDSEKHCVNLEGLAYHPEKVSYHLPTEAEWVYAASKNWNMREAWTADDSQFKLHNVCSKSVPSTEFCDLAGNAMEWVNDWLGTFRDTIVLNYVGPPDGGSLGQRVVKGGSYRNASGAVNFYSRGDVYAVTSSTRAEYVGFRLAYGSIPDAVWMDAEGKAALSRVILLANSSTLHSVVKTFNAKLAFRNDVSGNLAFVDYSSGAQTVVEIEDTLEVFHPDISPDGNLVAFCTKFEGVEGSSELYVRDLNKDGSHLVKLDFESAAIPRWRILENGDTAIVFVTSAGNNNDESAFRSASTWQVTFANGKFGTPQKLFDGAYHGGISKDDRLAVTGARRLRAKVADSESPLSQSARDTMWYNGEQACNVSLSQDKRKRTLFLDFGSTTGRNFVGKRYATHERLLIADSLGRLVQSIGAPAGMTFDHSEWVRGSSHLAVATLVNVNGSHRTIVLIDLTDSSFVNLVESDELWHPSLWVNENAFADDNSGLDLDSAAFYYDNVSNPLLSHKMNIFWSRSDSLNVVALGSSRMSVGFIANAITYGKAFNMAAIPSDMDVSLYLARYYVLAHCPQLKTIVVGLDFDLWNEPESTTLTLNFLSFPGYFYDYTHKYWVGIEGVEEIKNISRKIVEENEVLSGFAMNMGWVPVEEGFSWNNTGFSENFFINDSTWSDKPLTIRREMSNLQTLIEDAARKGVKVVGVVFPQSPEYANTGSYGRHGMRRSHALKLIEDVRKFEQRYDNFYLMDENKMGNHDYADSLAYDYDHLNVLGAVQITTRIDSVLNAIK